MEIELDDAGEYTVYYEYESVIQGRVFSSDRTLSGVLVVIARLGEPEPLKLTHVSERESYETGRYAGGSILTFEAEEPGREGLRITVGTDEQVDRFFEALDGVGS